MKTFHALRNIIKEIQGQNTSLEKAFASNIFDKGLLARISKEPLKLANEKTGYLKNEQYT